jgi:hypothetical protein
LISKTRKLELQNEKVPFHPEVMSDSVNKHGLKQWQKLVDYVWLLQSIGLIISTACFTFAGYGSF